VGQGKWNRPRPKDELLGSLAIVSRYEPQEKRRRDHKGHENTLASLRLRRPGDWHLIFVDHPHLGMLESVRDVTDVYRVTLPTDPPAGLLQRLREDSEMSIETYPASGGDSEFREYGRGEIAQVELHVGSFTVLWSTGVPAEKLIALLAPTIEGQMGDAWLTGEDDIPVADSVANVVAHVVQDSQIPSRYRFLRLELDDFTVTWSAPSFAPSADAGSRLTPGQVAIVCEECDFAWLRNLIERTSTERVGADTEALIEAAKRTADLVARQ
jgi:hypothetical protein